MKFEHNDGKIVIKLNLKELTKNPNILNEDFWKGCLSAIDENNGILLLLSYGTNNEKLFNMAYKLPEGVLVREKADKKNILINLTKNVIETLTKVKKYSASYLGGKKELSIELHN